MVSTIQVQVDPKSMELEIIRPIVFPLPFKILSLISFGLLIWAQTLHLLSFYNHHHLIDLHTLLDLEPTTDHPHQDYLSLPTTNTNTSNSNCNSNLHHNQYQRRSSIHRRTNHHHTQKIHQPIYYASLSIAILTIIGFILHRIVISITGHHSLDLIPLIYTLLVITISIIPGPTTIIRKILPFYDHFRTDRKRFIRSLIKILTQDLRQLPSLSEILLADILTSYSRVLGEISISICLIHSNFVNDRLGCHRNFFVPLLTSLPYAIRLRQCLSESISSTHPDRKRSFLNALKYATGFPMIILTNLIVGQNPNDPHTYTIFRLWSISSLINSFYSFWWDVSNDWNFMIFKPGSGSNTIHRSSGPTVLPPPPSILPTPTSRRTSPGSLSLAARARHPGDNERGEEPMTPDHTLRSQPTLQPCIHSEEEEQHPTLTSSSTIKVNPSSSSSNGWTNEKVLRAELLFRPRWIYLLIILINFGLRMVWILRVFGGGYELDGYVLESLEILRRGIWCVLRIEAEIVKGIGGGLMIGSSSSDGSVREESCGFLERVSGDDEDEKDESVGSG